MHANNYEQKQFYLHDLLQSLLSQEMDILR